MKRIILLLTVVSGSVWAGDNTASTAASSTAMNQARSAQVSDSIAKSVDMKPTFTGQLTTGFNTTGNGAGVSGVRPMSPNGPAN